MSDSEPDLSGQSKRLFNKFAPFLSQLSEKLKRHPQILNELQESFEQCFAEFEQVFQFVAQYLFVQMPPIQIDKSLQIKTSTIPDIGLGTFTLLPIQKEAFIGPYLGKLIPHDNSQSSEHKNKKYLMRFDDDFQIDGNPNFNYNHPICFVNDNFDHSKINCEFRKIDKDEYFSFDLLNQKRIKAPCSFIALYAKRSISINEELFASYGSSYWKKLLKNKTLDYDEFFPDDKSRNIAIRQRFDDYQKQGLDSFKLLSKEAEKSRSRLRAIIKPRELKQQVCEQAVQALKRNKSSIKQIALEFNVQKRNLIYHIRKFYPEILNE